MPPRALMIMLALLALLAAVVGAVAVTGGLSGAGPAPTASPSATVSTTASSTASSTTTRPVGSWWHPGLGLSWQWQLQGGLDLSVRADVYDVDLFETDAATVAAIHARGAKAICYVETGAWESYRPDAGAFPKALLGKGVADYPEERYLDVRRREELRRPIAARLDSCREKGFDGVEPDIDDAAVDVGAAGVGFPVTVADQVAYDTMVAELAHERGLAVGLKNGTNGDAAASFVTTMAPLVDFAVNEECAAQGVCALLQPLTRAGKAVFHTEYLTDRPTASTARPEPALAQFCPLTRPLRFSSILKDASDSLTAWRAACPA